MSRTRIVGGKITEIVHGDYTIYSEGDIIYNSAKAVTFEGKEGIVYGDFNAEVMPAPHREAISTAVVFFSPLKHWEGEYGFDWMRNNLYPFTVDSAYTEEADESNSTIIEGGYGGLTGGVNGSAIEELRKEFKSYPINIKDFPDTVYYVPYLTLFPKDYVDKMDNTKYTILPKYQVTLQTFIFIEEDIDKFIFKHNQTEIIGKYKGITIQGTISDGKKTLLDEKGKLKKGGTITITCEKALTETLEISVYAHFKNSAKRRLAGKFIILRNDEMMIRKEKVMLIPVWTKIMSDVEKGKIERTDRCVMNLLKSCYQTLIIPEITMSKELFGEDKGILNLENDADFNLYGFHGCGIYVNEGKRKIKEYWLEKDLEGNVINTLMEVLKTKFFNQVENLIDKEEYNSYTTVFFLNTETSSPENIAGTDYESINGNKVFHKSICIFKNIDEIALAHEFFHVLGLFHTHKDTEDTKEGKIVYPPNKKYVFAPNYTTNLMSYSINKKINENIIIMYPPCYSTWCWQWAIVNPAIKIEIENEKRR